MPRRAQDVCPQHASARQQPGEVVLARIAGAGRDGPRRLRRVLGLHGEERPHDVFGSVDGSGQMLRVQSPAGDVTVGEHTTSVGAWSEAGDVTGGE